MHQIHQTQGFILGHKNIKEADRLFYIYTRDFGLIYATAQGIRKAAAKLRGNLQDFSLVDLELVQGREIWRITSVFAHKACHTSPFGPADFSGEKSAETLAPSSSRRPHELAWHALPVFEFLNNLSKLIRRLCPGEEKSEELFLHIKESYNFLKSEDLDQEDLKNFECVTVLKILNTLGYVGESADISFFIASALTKPILKQVETKRRILVGEINKSIQESQL